MSSKQQDYRQYIDQVGEKIKNSPSRRELEKMKQDNAKYEHYGGYGDILTNSRERELVHKHIIPPNKPKETKKSHVSFQENMNNEVFEQSPNIVPFQPANMPAVPSTNYANYNGMGYNPMMNGMPNMNYNYPMQNSYYPQYPQMMGQMHQMGPQM
jgi:hypothetical protein